MLGTRTNYLSHKFLLVVLLSYVADFFMAGRLSEVFSLQPALIVGKMEFWRLITFPLAPGSVEAVLLFIVTYYLFAPKLEHVLNRVLGLIVMLVLVCLQGTVTSLVFWKSQMVFAGMEGNSFFVLAFFVYFNRNKKIDLFYIRHLNSNFVVLALLMMWVLGLLAHSFIGGTEIVITQGMACMAFGLLSAGFGILQVHFTKKFIAQKNEYSRIEIPKPEDLTPELISHSEFRKLNQTLRDEATMLDFVQPVYSEDRLNEILDKINEQGKDSLSEQEIQFLQDYSKHL